MANRAQKLKRQIRLYAPYIGAGIRVTEVADDFSTVRVEMPLRFYNRNYVGTHFGGSLYSMCDPFYMLMLINILGRDYIVWDKAATIRFKKPGKGLVKAVFNIPPERIAEIKASADSGAKVEPFFQVNVTDADGNIIAEIDKLLYVRRKTDLPKG